MLASVIDWGAVREAGDTTRETGHAGFRISYGDKVAQASVGGAVSGR